MSVIDFVTELLNDHVPSQCNAEKVLTPPALPGLPLRCYQVVGKVWKFFNNNLIPGSSDAE